MFLINSLKNNRFVLFSSFVILAFYNWTFFKHITQTYPLSEGNLGFIISAAVVCFSIIAFILSILCIHKATKPVLIVFVLTGAFAAYYMDSFDVIIDKVMIQNVMETNINEASDLLTFKLLFYALILGVLPVFVIYKYRLPQLTWREAFGGRLTVIVLLLLIIGGNVSFFSKNYSSFFREQKSIRYYVNPITPIYSFFNFVKGKRNSAPIVVKTLGEDAKISSSKTHRNLFILVIGETARWDHFSLNGYNKLTNPLLSKEHVVSFKSFTSCGTSTAVSVPCMFSNFGRDKYSNDDFKASENLVDVLTHAGVHVLWRDNNSDSKGVAERITYQDYKDNKLNTICDIECRDEGMLVGLQDYIDQKTTGDIMIVLHAMGSHGPAYFKRYPAAFEQFKPACQNNLLEKCTVEEINNAYDNTILYTDYFLSKTIALLKQNTAQFQSAMFYVGDHGESLGEGGVYLHGMPYGIAPEAQKHVGAIMWLSDNFRDTTFSQLKAKENQDFSHDFLFSTTLGLMNIETQVYNSKLDILK